MPATPSTIVAGINPAPKAGRVLARLVLDPALANVTGRYFPSHTRASCGRLSRSLGPHQLRDPHPSAPLPLNRCCGLSTRSAASAVAAREKELRADLESLGTRDKEPEGIGQPIYRVEREADRERVLNLLARDIGGQYRTH